MYELKNTIAVNTAYLENLQESAKQILESAGKITTEIEKYTKSIDESIEKLPNGVKRSGTQLSILKAKKNAHIIKYSNVKKNMNTTLKKLKEDVPKYDKTCGDVADKLVIVTKSLTKRIENLQNLVASGSIDFEDNSFYEQLAKCIEDWEKDEEYLKQILKEIENALKGVYDEACRYSADPVNLSTGNFIYNREDVKIKGIVPLCFHRYYNSVDERVGVLGAKWKHNYEICLLLEEEKLIVLKDDGKEDSFVKAEDGYKSIVGSQYSLFETDIEYIYKERYGSKYIFDKQGKLIKLTDANGNHVEFTYNQNNDLEKAESLSGSLFYSYDKNGKLKEVKDHSGRKVILQYEEDQLCKVTMPTGADYVYTYGIDGLLKSIVNPQGVETVKNRFDKASRTKKQIFPDGGIMRFLYDDEKRTVIMSERNGSKVCYEHDVQYRNIRTAYSDGEETWTYNRYNQKTSYTDKNGNRTVYAYDNLGNLTKIIDACGNATHITYGGHKKPIHIKTPEGGEFSFHYDKNGNMIKQVDSLGNETNYRYDNNGELIEVVKPDGTKMVLSYDNRGNVSAIIHPDGGTVEYTYDNLNRIIQTIDENGNRMQYEYDAADRIVKVVNAEGNVRNYSYNVSGLVTEMEDFDGRKITRGYNALNKLKWESDKEGNVTEYEYDLMWNINKVTLPNKGEILYQYNELNQIESITNPLGGILYYFYDKNGNIIRVENATEDAVAYSYDAMNRKIAMVDALGNQQEFYYDAMGRIIREKDALSRTFDAVYDSNGNKIAEVNCVNGGFSYTYDCMGRIRSVTDGIGRVRKYIYDVCGRVTELEDFDGNRECYIYDKKGNVICKKNGSGIEYHYVYDMLNRLIEIQCDNNILKRYTYNAVGNCLSETDANGNQTNYHYTPNGHMDRVTDAEGNSTSYLYDAMGQIEKIIYPSEEGERAVSYERNLLGNITKITDSLGYMESFEYDVYGKLVGKTDRNNQHTNFQRNAMGDITNIRYEDGKEVLLSYDPLREIEEVKDWTGTTCFMKDVAGRTREITDSFGNTVSYEWGILGERTGMVYSDGKKIAYKYDQYLNLIETIAEENKTSYSYDENGRLSKKEYANGMISRYNYTPDGKLESLIHEDKEGILDRFCYVYDKTGNCIAEERKRRNLHEENGNYGYAYDSLGRLITVEKDGIITKNYEYDAYGNRAVEKNQAGEIRYTYNEANQLIKKEDMSGTVDYSYDFNGNLLQVMQDGCILSEYRYDSIGNMIFSETKNGNAEYQYNGFGKKISMEIGQTERTDYILDYTKGYNNLLQRKTDNRTEDYFWDGNLLSASYSIAKNPTSQNKSGYTMTYLLDQLGSPLRFCDVEGESEEYYGYGAFGEDLYSKENTVQPFGFTGYEEDHISGLYYAQARRYDAVTGRFTSRDMIKGSISQLQSQNEYAYCLDNPLMYVDRDGRKAVEKGKRGTHTLKFVVNANAGLGIGGDFDLSWDRKGNVVLQYSYVCPGVDDTISAGGLDVGVAGQYQWTNAESVYNLEGNSSYVGASIGNNFYIGYDAVSFDDISDIPSSVNGGQFQFGWGQGLDIHLTEGYTVTLKILKEGNDEQKS